MLARWFFPLLVVAAQLGAQQAALRTDDSTYASVALSEMVALAAIQNARVPAALASYRARVESELSLIIRDTLGRELVSQVEQVASDAQWNRRVGYTMHVDGYRVQTVGVPFSAISIVNGWTLPMLYGDRLRLGIEGTGQLPGQIVRRSNGRADTIVAVHPFAADRGQFYRFTGGDTVATIRTPTGREIPVARIRVAPLARPDSAAALFDGEIDIDATRHQIVRMRGRLVMRRQPGQPSAYGRLATLAGAIGVAYIDFTNEEVSERYWLPVEQRIEFQAGLALFGDYRSVFRIVSHFAGFVIDDTTNVSDAPRDDGLDFRRVTYAPTDSVNTYSGWMRPLGAATSAVHADDFIDLAPSSWRSTGVPRLTFYPSQYDRMVHFNRVEGLYTGAEGSLYLRDAAPGVSGHVYGGWDWAGHTVRGGIAAAVARKNLDVGASADRAVVSTNDFPVELSNEDAGLAGLLASVDDADYVGRSSASFWASRVLGSLDQGIATVRFAAARDENEVEQMTHGLLAPHTFFRPNRNSATGNYALAEATLELHPNVSSDFTQQGIHARLHAEDGFGQLSWRRVEASLGARSYLGPITLSEQLDGGAVFGTVIPPQQLFELGGDERLPGYSYKQFAGDQAMLFRAFANYGFPIDRKPHRLGRIVLPGLSPGLGAGIEGGWSRISTAAAQTAVDALGAGWSAVPVSVATNGVRASAGFGLTFLSGAVHVGLVTPIDQRPAWKWAFGFGQVF